MIISNQYTFTNDQENLTEDDIMFICFKTKEDYDFKNKLYKLLCIKKIRKYLMTKNFESLINLNKVMKNLNEFNFDFDCLKTNDQKIKIIEYFDSIGLMFLNIDDIITDYRSKSEIKILNVKLFFNYFIEHSNKVK